MSLIELQLLSIVAIFPFPLSLPCQLSILHGCFVLQNSSHGNKLLYSLDLVINQNMRIYFEVLVIWTIIILWSNCHFLELSSTQKTAVANSQTG